MKNYNSILDEQLKLINKLIVQSNKNIAKYKDLPNYGIKVSKSNGCNQYYLVDKESGALKYANKKYSKLVKRIAQRDYEISVNKKLSIQKEKLEKFISGYDIESIEKAYLKLSPARRKLITPLIETDEAYIQKWIDENPDHQNDYYGEGKILTTSGGYVRSKSERIIADLLDKYNVPYRYEAGLYLWGNHCVYPDFTVLNVRKRKTYYWEHFGLINDFDYSRKNFEKINDYEQAGFMLGDKLIISMETRDASLNIKLIEEKIKRYCL